MEAFGASKHLTPPGCHYHSPPAHFELDVWRGLTGIHREEPQCRSTQTCRFHPVVFIPRLLQSLGIRRRQGPLLPPRLQCDPRGPQRSTWLSCDSPHRYVDLTQPNILVDNSGCVRIADFGLAAITQNVGSIPSASRHHGHTARWAAPEILNEGRCSREADVFSFAMVMIEVRCLWPVVYRAPAHCRFISIRYSLVKSRSAVVYP